MLTNRTNYKMLAVIFMVIDHAGAILFGNNLIMRLIGRLSFPMFVYLLYDGYRNTRDLAAYGRRMIWFWAVSIVPYSLAFYNCLVSVNQNVFLSLYVYLTIFCVFEDRSIWRKYAFTILCAIAAERFNLEYGWYGVALAVIICTYKNNLQAAEQFLWITCLDSLVRINPRQLTSPLAIALTPAEFAESKRPSVAFKIFNYIFYPLHLLMLWVWSVMY